jgi:hypothetical protein
MKSTKYTDQFASAEQDFLNSLDPDDCIPLSYLIGNFCNVNSPTEEGFLQTLEFIRYMSEKYGSVFKYCMWPGDEWIQKTPEDFIDWLKKDWYAGKYEEMHHGVWFDLDPLPEEYANRVFPPITQEEINSFKEYIKKLYPENRKEKPGV